MNSIDMINDLEKGLEFIGKDKVVTVFGSARMSPEDPIFEKTVELTYLISKRLGLAVMTGGGHGVMEAANKGAKLAEVKSYGINVMLPHEQETNGYVSNGFVCKYLFTRKVILTTNAVGFIAINGGYGTLDELFEVLTLISVGNIKPIPVILYGVEFWGGMYEWIKSTLLSRGYINDVDFNHIHLTSSEEEILDILKKVI